MLEAVSEMPALTVMGSVSVNGLTKLVNFWLFFGESASGYCATTCCDREIRLVLFLQHIRMDRKRAVLHVCL